MVSDFRKNLPWSLAWYPGIRSLLVFVYRCTLPLGWVWPIPYTIGVLLFTNYNGWDPLLWRSFDKGQWLMDYMVNNYWHTNDYSDHHFLNLASVSILFFVMAWWLAKNTGGFDLKRFYSMGLLASYAGLYTWALHEGIWWITYILYYPGDYRSITQFAGAGEIVTASLIILSLALGTHFPKRYFLAMIGFYLLWVAFGFPLTNTYLGPTAGYFSPWNNGWEVFSWIFAVSAYYVLERKSLLAWYLKVKQITTNGHIY